MEGGEALSTGLPTDTASRMETRSFSESIKNKYGMDDFDAYDSGDDIKLNMIAVPKADRKQGIGGKALDELTDFADQQGKRIKLSVGQKDDVFGTTSRTRLVKFYKRHGFVENKGRNKDFTISEGMFRDPVK